MQMYSLSNFLVAYLVIVFISFKENDHELRFFMVDGDFKKFEGKWTVKSRKGYAIFCFCASSSF